MIRVSKFHRIMLDIPYSLKCFNVKSVYITFIKVYAITYKSSFFFQYTRI